MRSVNFLYMWVIQLCVRIDNLPSIDKQLKSLRQMRSIRQWFGQRRHDSWMIHDQQWLKCLLLQKLASQFVQQSKLITQNLEAVRGYSQCTLCYLQSESRKVNVSGLSKQVGKTQFNLCSRADMKSICFHSVSKSISVPPISTFA